MRLSDNFVFFVLLFIPGFVTAMTGSSVMAFIWIMAVIYHLFVFAYVIRRTMYKGYGTSALTLIVSIVLLNVHPVRMLIIGGMAMRASLFALYQIKYSHGPVNQIINRTKRIIKFFHSSHSIYIVHTNPELGFSIDRSKYHNYAARTDRCRSFLTK